MNNYTENIEFNKNFYRSVLSESIRIAILFFITVFVVYFLPNILSRFFVVFLALLFLKSKKDYFWIVFFFVLYSQPAGFFAAGSASAQFRLPLFTFLPGNSFSTIDIFILLMFFKAFNKKRRYTYLLSTPLRLIIFDAIVLFILSFTAYNSSIQFVLNLFRKAFYFSLLFSFPVLVHKREDIYKFCYILFPMLIFTFITSLYFIISGNYFVDLFDPGSLRDLRMVTADGQIIKRFGAIISDEYIYLTFVSSLALLYIPTIRKRNSSYLYLIAISSYLLISFTATRAWFIIYTMIFLFYLYKGKNKVKTIFFTGFILFAILGGLAKSPIASAQLGNIWQRLSTVFRLGEQDAASTQSLENRINFDVPIALEGIRQNPFLGWGFSENYIKFANSDTGNFALIVQVGFVGFFLFVYLWIAYFSIMRKAQSVLSRQNPYKNIINLFIVAFVGLLMSHFMTTQIFGLDIRSFLVAIFIYMSEFFIREAENYEKQISG